jgi:hypothetical protein
MSLESLQKIIEGYLNGSIEPDAAAAALQAEGRADGFFLQYGDADDPKTRAKLEALAARVLWLELRSVSPEGVPSEPFNAEQLRAIVAELAEKEPLGESDIADGNSAE